MTKDSDYPYPDSNGRWTYQGKIFRCLPKSFATRFLKKTILVGITYLDHEANEIEKKQFWGIITSITAKQGIEVTNPDTNKKFYLPPDLACVYPAKKGEYRLKSSGEIVTDPDYLTTWTSTKPPQGNWENLTERGE